MENHIFAWADLAADLVVAAAIIAALFCFSACIANITGLLRVIRRMDRKTADTTRSGYRPRTDLAAWPEMPPDGRWRSRLTAR
jgi:hypothetical protein